MQVYDRGMVGKRSKRKRGSGGPEGTPVTRRNSMSHVCEGSTSDGEGVRTGGSEGMSALEVVAERLGANEGSESLSAKNAAVLAGLSSLWTL